MANERLRSAITTSGLTAADLSEQVGVDPKTIERWILTDRIPHRTNRQAMAAALRRDEEFLWPTAVSESRVQSASQAEFVALHPNRGSVPAGSWQSLLEGADESIDLLAYAASFLHDTIPDFDDILIEKASAGVRVRLLFGDPDGSAVRLRGEEGGIGDSLAGRCTLTWKYLQPCLGVPGIEARQHDTTLYTSIFRFDEDLLANTHAYGAAANQSPILHLHRISGGRLFPHYMTSFDLVWNHANESLMHLVD
ncbi:MAG: XRE family transcriptional regulator [Intrasporangium sp.]|uniref:XRE family transcriptional regulator n=1 Tax=Intrasporangium sp. TaxID=1925024 RepID=UPI0026481A18|nr:XRE family transcriptional regulator [Intrasporangium sp.]MDN5795877.1 XRE family transcriptional regulator [Intrasporangium sp.]